MKCTRLYIIRHGQVVGHDDPRYNGHTDVDLTPLGRAQMEAAAEELADVDLAAVYSSDLKRARYGGEHLVRNRSLTLQIDSGLRELYFGQWEGLNYQEVSERYPGAMDLRLQDPIHFRMPGGETIGEFWVRVGTKMTEILSRHAGSTIAVVAHSGVNRVVLLQALGAQPEHIWRIDQSYGCLNIVDYYQDGLTMVKLANKPNKHYAGPGLRPPTAPKTTPNDR